MTGFIEQSSMDCTHLSGVNSPTAFSMEQGEAVSPPLGDDQAVSVSADPQQCEVGQQAGGERGSKAAHHLYLQQPVGDHPSASTSSLLQRQPFPQFTDKWLSSSSSSSLQHQFHPQETTGTDNHLSSSASSPSSSQHQSHHQSTNSQPHLSTGFQNSSQPTLSADNYHFKQTLGHQSLPQPVSHHASVSASHHVPNASVSAPHNVSVSVSHHACVSAPLSTSVSAPLYTSVSEWRRPLSRQRCSQVVVCSSQYISDAALTAQDLPGVLRQIFY